MLKRRKLRRRVLIQGLITLGKNPRFTKRVSFKSILGDGRNRVSFAYLCRRVGYVILKIARGEPKCGKTETLDTKSSWAVVVIVLTTYAVVWYVSHTQRWRVCRRWYFCEYYIIPPRAKSKSFVGPTGMVTYPHEEASSSDRGIRYSERNHGFRSSVDIFFLSLSSGSMSNDSNP
jgi:hypothetical protein